MSKHKKHSHSNESGDSSVSAQHTLALNTPIMEAYRILRTNIEFSSNMQKIQVLLITSSLQGEGKSTTASNLARAFALSGTKTLILDLDLRRPVQHKFHSVENKVGASDVLMGEAAILDAIQPTQTENLYILPSGGRPSYPTELLSVSALPALIASLRQSFDMIIMDTPPINILADAAMLTKEADASILVVSAGRTEVDDLNHSIEALRRTGTNLLGTVLNNVVKQSSNYKYRYYYYDY